MNIFHNYTKGNLELKVNEDNLFTNEELHSYHSLWKAVITQALIDPSSNSKKKFSRKNKLEAIRWLTSKDEEVGLKKVCQLADINYKNISCKIKNALLKGCKWRNDNKKNDSLIRDDSFVL